MAEGRVEAGKGKIDPNGARVDAKGCKPGLFRTERIFFRQTRPIASSIIHKDLVFRQFPNSKSGRTKMMLKVCFIGCGGIKEQPTLLFQSEFRACGCHFCYCVSFMEFALGGYISVSTLAGFP